jgi:hypothetical protein
MAKQKNLTKKAAQKILATVDTWGGKPMTEAQLKKFGYIKTEGGVWELPTHILKAAGIKVGKTLSPARRLTRT